MAETRRLASEAEFLSLVDKHFSNKHPHMALGRGDDCAELICPHDLCMTSDLFLEDVHFRTSYFSPRDIGWKALAVNFSDLAAAGARPVGWNMNLMLPKGVSLDYVDALLQGMADLAGQYDAPLTGGDLSRADKLGVSITAWGAPAAGVGGKFLRRSGGQAGDALFLGREGTHDPGLARVGLLDLEETLRGGPAAPNPNSHSPDFPVPLAAYPTARAAHLRPRPLLELGQTLALAGVAALMDVSDGLARDLPRLLGHEGNCKEGRTPGRDPRQPLGADIRLDPGLLHPEVLAFARARGLDPVREAFLGGEDYLLLGACSKAVLRGLLEQGANLLPLGVITAGPDMVVNGQTWTGSGFDHFS